MEQPDKSTQDEIIDQLILDVNELKRQEVKLPDYTQEFMELQDQLNEQLPHYRGVVDTLREVIQEHNLSYPADRIQAHLDELRKRLAAMPESISVKHDHRFDLKTKGWIISGTILLVVTALSTGLTGYLITRNRQYQAIALKYRLAGQVAPKITGLIDSAYSKDPKQTELYLERLERGDTISRNESQTKKKPVIKAGRKKRKRT